MLKSLFEKPSLLIRITVGKGIGLLIGLLGFLLLPSFWPEADPLLRWGILFWYTTMGAIVGVFGVLDYHPVLRLPFPWWVRAPVLGAWLNFVLVFFAYDVMQEAIVAFTGTAYSPFLFVLEGAIVAFVIGGLATRFGGEGRRTAEVLRDG